MRWTTAALFVVYGLSTLVATHFLDLAAQYQPVIAAISGSSLTFGIAVILSGRWIPQLPRAAHHTVLVVLTLLIGFTAHSAGNYPDQRASSLVAMLMPLLPVLLGAAALFSLRAATLHLIAGGVVAVWVLAASGIPSGAAILAASSTLAATVMVAVLARQATAAEWDALTGLRNRRGFLREVELAVGRADAGEHALGLVMLDLDQPERVGARSGPRAGDLLIAETARRWSARLPEDVLLSRYGGSMFGLLVTGRRLGAVTDLADETRTDVPADVTASSGVAAWVPGETAAALVAHAQTALAQAKAAGRGRTVVHGDPWHTASRIEAALTNGEMFLLYQPIVDLDSGRIRSFEALIRWRDPRRGIVPPLEFIPQAEATGAIHAVGRWTVGRVCRDVMAAPDHRRPVSINVAVSELRNPRYASGIAGVLEEWGMPGELLIIEVLERDFDDDPQINRSLEELRALGCLIALDDFGAGYSSLGRLHTMPIDAIKVDGALVMAIPEDDDEAPILEAVGEMGRRLGVRLVGEHVETRHQAEVLGRLGFARGQGYFFSPPVNWETAQRLDSLP
ncbi:putative bifunctional diguanylate cyclase/phosphodiesterase [Georgenia deserti]|uniref:Bifunctional diguanylate cyclase/phosphodiesterase n=1 Tax=Georgenia deserti TaxID=2093781 RepID=A0ABW4L7X9_9MICO